MEFQGLFISKFYQKAYEMEVTNVLSSKLNKAKAKHTAKAIHIFWIGYYAKANMCHPAFSKETKKEMNVSKLVGEIFRGRLSLVS